MATKIVGPRPPESSPLLAHNLIYNGESQHLGIWDNADQNLGVNWEGSIGSGETSCKRSRSCNFYDPPILVSTEHLSDLIKPTSFPTYQQPSGHQTQGTPEKRHQSARSYRRHKGSESWLVKNEVSPDGQ